MQVILADDAVLFREGTARILTEAGFHVTGQAGTAAGLLDLVRHDPPAVAVIDIRMPPGHGTEGIDAAAEIDHGTFAGQTGEEIDTAHQSVEAGFCRVDRAD
jgi:DNA-binding NarL/FixJ family response regulator